MTSVDTFEVLDGGTGATMHDVGRFGWQRFGVPPSGPMDDHAFGWANRLLNNPPDAPCVEILMGGFRARTLRDCMIALTGADLGARLNSNPLIMWKSTEVRQGDAIALPGGRAGLWCYLAVSGGFDAAKYFGSASVYPRGGLGRSLRAGDRLTAKANPANAPGLITLDVVPDYTAQLVVRVVPGPQEEMFSDQQTAIFYASEYKVTSQIDRIGYRLEGPAIRATLHDILSEGISYGAIQIPENGQPIVMMKDRPTVGGYPKIGTLLPEDTARLAQCRPGQTVRFQCVET